MSYPSVQEVEAAASNQGLSVRTEYAFAATNGRVTHDQPEGTAFQASIIGFANSNGIPQEVMLGYVGAFGTTADKATVISWAQSNNYIASNGTYIQAPPIGAFYPGATTPPPVNTSGGQPTVTAPSNPFAALTTPISILGIQIAPIVPIIGVAGVAILAGRKGR